MKVAITGRARGGGKDDDGSSPHLVNGEIFVQVRFEGDQVLLGGLQRPHLLLLQGQTCRDTKKKRD